MRTITASLVLLSVLACCGGDREDRRPDRPQNRRAAQPARPAATPGSQAPSKVSATERPRPRAAQGGDTLWLGNSLVRYRASEPYKAYDIVEILESMRTLAAREGRELRPAQRMRVLASDGFGLHGWWNSWFGYGRPDGTRYSAAQAIVEDPENTRRYDPRLGYQPLPPGSGGWDRIVLLTVLNHRPESQWYGAPDADAEVPNIERWCRFIKEQNPRTEILHYVAPVDSRRIRQLQGRVDAAYEQVRETCGGRIVPVGRAFLNVMNERPDLELRRPLAQPGGDFLHYNDHGVYLASAVFFAVMYGDPVGVGVPEGLDISPADAELLARVARSTVQ